MIPVQVHTVASRYLELADRALPQRIEGLYLVGSIALNDYQPGKSDIDFVAVTGTALLRRELDQMKAVHQALHREFRRPWFSGVYVTWADLLRSPLLAENAAFHYEGQFGYEGGFEANPSVWTVMQNYAIALRGMERPPVRCDLAETRQWNLDNLNAYWRQWASHNKLFFGRGLMMLADRSVEWGVCGVARLHFTIATGNVISKTGACEYAMERFPEQWRQIVAQALSIRRGHKPARIGRMRRRQEALRFIDFVIRDANSIR